MAPPKAHRHSENPKIHSGGKKPFFAAAILYICLQRNLVSQIGVYSANHCAGRPVFNAYPALKILKHLNCCIVIYCTILCLNI